MDEPMGQIDGNLAFALGKMDGQLRELIHSLGNLRGSFDNLNAKVDGLTREVSGLATLAISVGKMEAEVASLKLANAKRDGAGGTWAMILKSPALGWLGAALVALWAVLTGKTP